MVRLLASAEARRALRSIVQALVALAVVALLFVLAHQLRGNARALRSIAVGALIIVGLGTLLYGAENVTRAVRLRVSRTGVVGEIGCAPDCTEDEEPGP